MADGINNGSGGGTDGAEVVCERENRPVVGDGAEVGVLGVGEFAVVDELSTDNGVLAALVGRADSL
jgi:hypothetical protein